MENIEKQCAEAVKGLLEVAGPNPARYWCWAAPPAKSRGRELALTGTCKSPLPS